MEQAIVCLIGFVLGSVPFGVLVAKSQGVDILRSGSGNVGATNVWREVSPAAGVVVFLFDFAKGLAPALIARAWLGSEEWAFAAGVAAILGHSFSPFIGFKGGKGIATGFGAVMGASPATALSSFGIFLILTFLTRYVSVGSIAACFALVTFGFVYGDPQTLQIAYALVAALVLFKHRGNMKRLLNGTERKFGSKKPEQQAVVQELVLDPEPEESKT